MQTAHSSKELLRALAVVAAVAAGFIIVLHNITGLLG
jgi:hypothetical protein